MPIPVQPRLCAQCPWRASNHGRRTPGGFYAKRNLQRLWNQIRRGGGIQTCHLTDQSHPDHVAAGAREDRDEKHECMGSVVMVVRELEVLKDSAPGDVIQPEHVEAYLKVSPKRKGLTKTGLMYYILARQHEPPVGEGVLPMPPRALLESDEIARLAV